MRKTTLVLLSLLILFLIFTISSGWRAEASEGKFFNFRVGGKFLPVGFQQEMFLPWVSATVGPLGLDLAGNVTAFTLDDNYTLGSTQYNARISGFIDYYSAHLKYVLPDTGGVEPSFGVGIFGTGTSGSASVTEGGGSSIMTSNLHTGIGGFDFLFGVDFSLRGFGIPLVLSGGINHYNFNTLFIDASVQNGLSYEVEENLNYYLSFFHYFFGISYEF
ncbi:hypothetical protein KGY64_02265 [Candidatus Bipolaricaulota bacterium]|nr:hypothetical protein [Candidatus Bipolaricaulota bacterium]